MKKSLVFILAIVLMLCSTCFISYATGDLTISAIEADADGITIYPSSAVTTAAIIANAELYQNGVLLENLVCEQIATVSSYSSIWANPTAYIIKPEGGMQCNIKYDFQINEGLLSSDGLYELKSDYTKSFVVKLLLSDDFSTYNAQNLVTGTWNYVQLSTNPAYYGSATVTGDGCLQIATGSSNSSSIAFVNSDYANQKTWSDYTVEYDFTPANKGSSSNYYRLAFFTDKPSGDTSRLIFHSQYNAIRIFSDGNYKVQNCNLAVGGTYRIKHVMKGKHYQTFLNGEKVFDYTNENGYSSTGAPEIVPQGDNATYQFDNIKITKMVELGDLTMAGIEVDAEGITVYPSAQVDSSALAQSIELYEGGAQLENLVCQKVDAVNGYSSTWANPLCYIIKPANGLRSDMVYQLKIKAGLMSSDYTLDLKSDYNKYFTVRSLLSDDFSTYNAENPVTGAWNYVQLSTNQAYHGSATVTGDGCLQIATGSSNSGCIAFVNSDYANQKSWNDYTMEYDFTPVNKGSSGSYYRLALFTDKPIDNLNRLAFLPQENGIRIYSDGNYKFQSYNLSVGGTYRIKHVLQGKHYQTYINGVKVIDYTNENGYTATGAPEIIPQGDNATYQFDNIRITKMEEIADAIEIGSFSVSDMNGNSISTISGQTAVNGDLSVVNAYAESKPCKILVASYNNNVMKNVQVLETESLPAGSSPVSFSAFQVNGGTQIKVFVFSDFANIYPYCMPAVE